SQGPARSRESNQWAKAHSRQRKKPAPWHTKARGDRAPPDRSRARPVWQDVPIVSCAQSLRRGLPCFKHIDNVLRCPEDVVSRATKHAPSYVPGARARVERRHGERRIVNDPRCPNKRPDRFDLLHVEHAAPRRHLSLAVEHRIDETIMVGRTQTREVERGAAAGVAQLIAVAIGTVVPVNR